MSTDKTSLGDRMKSYENAYRIKLTPRMPVILRLDGVAFHTLTKGFERPMDSRIVEAMNAAAITLCKKLQGACYAYVQSDEISILLVDYKHHNSQAWFGKNLQKMVSVSAGIASTTFTHALEKQLGTPVNGGIFDSRVIQLPDNEVENYFIWRQRDCSRNSILALGQAHFSHKQLQGKKVTDILRMLTEDLKTPVIWEDCALGQKFGHVVQRTFKSKGMFPNKKTGEFSEVKRFHWAVEESDDITSPDGIMQRLSLRTMAFQTKAEWS